MALIPRRRDSKADTILNHSEHSDSTKQKSCIDVCILNSTASFVGSRFRTPLVVNFFLLRISLVGPRFTKNICLDVKSTFLGSEDKHGKEMVENGDQVYQENVLGLSDSAEAGAVN